MCTLPSLETKQTETRRHVLLAFFPQVAQEEMDVDKEWVDHLSKRMYDAVMSRIPDVTLNGDHDKRYPGNLNFSFAYVEVNRLLRACGVAHWLGPTLTFWGDTPHQITRYFEYMSTAAQYCLRPASIKWLIAHTAYVFISVQRSLVMFKIWPRLPCLRVPAALAIAMATSATI